MNRRWQFIGYGVVALLAFVFSFVLLFPYDQLNSRLVGEVERSLGGRWHLKIGHLSARPIAHITVKDIELVESGPDAVSLLKLDRVGIGVSLLSTLFGSPKFGFRIRGGKGEVEGDFKSGSEIIYLEAELDDWNIDTIGFLKQQFGLELTSRVDGDMDLELYKTDPIRHQGDMTLKIQELKILPSKFHLGGGGEGLEIDLPELELAKKGHSGLECQIGKGRVEINKIKMNGEDLDLAAEGQLFLAREPADWRLNVKGRFKPSAKLAGAVAVLFIVDKQKDAEGYYPFSITGRLARPNVRIGSFRVPL